MELRICSLLDSKMRSGQPGDVTTRVTFSFKIIIRLFHDPERGIIFEFGGPHCDETQCSASDFLVCVLWIPSSDRDRLADGNDVSNALDL